MTESQQDTKFLPSLAPTNHLAVLVDISIFFYLKENEEFVFFKTNCSYISLGLIPLSLHRLNWHRNSEFSCPSPRGISLSTSPSWYTRALKKLCLLYFFPAQGFGEKCLLCKDTKEQNTNQLTLPATKGNIESQRCLDP